MRENPSPCPQSLDDPCSKSGVIVGRGLCRKHYQRWWKNGSPQARKYTRAVANDWQSKVEWVSPGCWEWTASLNYGYGWYSGPNFSTKMAHRYVYQELVRPLADNEHLDHLCRNTRCVNPDHLEVVTHTENVNRGAAGAGKRRRTRCVNGHEFTPENTIINPNGHRACRECVRTAAREGQRRRRAEQKLGIVKVADNNNATKTHCKHGHPFDEANTYIIPSSGQRSCRACQRARLARRRAAASTLVV